MWGKGSSRGNGDGFFSSRCKIEGNPALPLGFIEDGVHYLKGDHLTVHLHPSFLAHLLNVTPNNRSFDFETEEICIVSVWTNSRSTLTKIGHLEVGGMG